MAGYRIETVGRNWPTGRDIVSLAVVLWDAGPAEYLQFFPGVVPRIKAPAVPDGAWWDGLAATLNRRIVLMVDDEWTLPADLDSRTDAVIIPTDPAMFDMMTGDTYRKL